MHTCTHTLVNGLLGTPSRGAIRKLLSVGLDACVWHASDPTDNRLRSPNDIFICHFGGFTFVVSHVCLPCAYTFTYESYTLCVNYLSRVLQQMSHQN